jgi:hypothetical protein
MKTIRACSTTITCKRFAYNLNSFSNPTKNMSIKRYLAVCTMAVSSL